MFSRFFGGAKKEEEPVREPITAPNDVYFCRPKLNPCFLLPPYLVSEEAVAGVKPPKTVMTIEDRLTQLDDKQTEAYKKMVEKIGPETFESQGGFTVLRYLVARNWDVEKASALLADTLVWRKTLPNFCKWCQEDPRNHMAEFVGWDKLNRPVIYMTYRYAKERGDADASEHHMASSFDHAVRMMPEGVTQWVTMVDFATFSILRDSSTAVAKRILGVLSNHFPERLGLFILVNPIGGTWVLYKALSPFLDEKTKNKVRFAYSNGNPSLNSTFDDLFPPHLAKYLIARYSENYQNLPIGALDKLSEEEIAKANAEAAAKDKELHKDEVHVASLDEADKVDVSEVAAAASQEEGEDDSKKE